MHELEDSLASQICHAHAVGVVTPAEIYTAMIGQMADWSKEPVEHIMADTTLRFEGANAVFRAECHEFWGEVIMTADALWTRGEDGEGDQMVTRLRFTQPLVARRGSPSTSECGSKGDAGVIRRRAADAFDLAALVLPARMADEEFGDALEAIAALEARGAAPWRLWLKVGSSLIWAFVNAWRGRQ